MTIVLETKKKFISIVKPSRLILELKTKDKYINFSQFRQNVSKMLVFRS